MSVLLEGKTAIVTGAAGGIGRVLADGLLEAGARVVATDVNDAALGELENALRNKHPSADFACQHVDVADYAACVQSVQGAIERFGGLHILINNAGLGLVGLAEGIRRRSGRAARRAICRSDRCYAMMTGTIVRPGCPGGGAAAGAFP